MSEKNYIYDEKYDRLLKYGFGFIRLLILLLILTFFDKGFKLENFGYLHRWSVYILIAFIGASFNVKLFGFILQIIFLVLVICLVIYDLSYDYTVLLYGTKTLIPDFFASKLDGRVGKLLLFVNIGAVLFCHFLPNPLENSIFDIGSFWLIIALGQLFCELGDQHFEHLTFFRHRYSFEFSMLIIWFFISLSSTPENMKADGERKLFYFDMVAALSYRGTGFILKYLNLDFRKKELSN